MFTLFLMQMNRKSEALHLGSADVVKAAFYVQVLTMCRGGGFRCHVRLKLKAPTWTLPVFRSQPQFKARPCTDVKNLLVGFPGPHRGFLCFSVAKCFDGYDTNHYMKSCLITLTVFTKSSCNLNLLFLGASVMCLIRRYQCFRKCLIL